MNKLVFYLVSFYLIHIYALKKICYPPFHKAHKAKFSDELREENEQVEYARDIVLTVCVFLMQPLILVALIICCRTTCWLPYSLNLYAFNYFSQ